jgi:adenosine deaminase
MKLDGTLLRAFPKVLLHEHLDGVLRPQTVIELANRVKYSDLPAHTPETLGQWFQQGANRGSLAKYLEGFAHTIAVMQTEEALARVAYEQAEDLSKDGVVYFETRFAPFSTPRRDSRTSSLHAMCRRRPSAASPALNLPGRGSRIISVPARLWRPPHAPL